MLDIKEGRSFPKNSALLLSFFFRCKSGEQTKERKEDLFQSLYPLPSIFVQVEGSASPLHLWRGAGERLIMPFGPPPSRLAAGNPLPGGGVLARGTCALSSNYYS